MGTPRRSSTRNVWSSSHQPMEAKTVRKCWARRESVRRPLSVKDTGDYSAQQVWPWWHVAIPKITADPQMKSTWLDISVAWPIRHTGHHLLDSSPVCMTFMLSRWKTHKWRRCQLVPWSVRQDSPGAQETCGPGMQVRGMESHSLVDNDSTTRSWGDKVVQWSPQSKKVVGSVPAGGLSVCGLHVGLVLKPLWVLSWFSGFLPESDNMYVRQTGNSELSVGLCECWWLSVFDYVAMPWIGDWSTLYPALAPWPTPSNCILHERHHANVKGRRDMPVACKL